MNYCRTTYILIAFVALMLPAISHAAITANTSSKSLSTGLVGYWTFDGKDTNWLNSTTGTTSDSSTSGNTGTLTNMNRSTSPTKGVFGQALKFVSASDQYVSLGNPAALQITGNLTISVWIKLNSVPAANQSYQVVAKDKDTGGRAYTLDICNDTAGTYVAPGTLAVRFYINGGGANSNGGNNIVGNTSLVVGKWYHIVGVYNTAGTLNLYVNGVSDQTQRTGELGAIPSATANVFVGRREYTGYTEPFDGTIDDVRIYNRSLSASEALKLYNLNKTAIAAPQKSNTSLTTGLVTQWTLDGKDTSWAGNTTNDIVSGNTATMVSMAKSITPVTGKIGQAFWFDGASSYTASGGVFSSLGTSNQPYTLSAWIQPAVSSETGNIFHVSSASDGSGWCLGMVTIVNGNATTNSWTGGISTATGNTSLKANMWYHIAATWDTSGLKIYVNGKLDASPTAQATFSASGSSNYIFLGKNGTACANGQTWFKGKIDDARVYNRALSASEIQKLAALGSDTINASQNGKYKNGLVGLWSLDGKDVNWLNSTTGTTTDGSGNGYTGTLNSLNRANAPIVGKFGQAINFTRYSGQTISVDAISSVIATGDVSISLWFKLASAHGGASANAYLFRLGDAPSDNDMDLLLGSGSGKLCFDEYDAGFNYSCGTPTFWSAGVWHHAVGVYSATTGSKLYIDGVQDGSNSHIGRGSTASTHAAISNIDAGTEFDGAIDEVRVYNRALSASDVQKLYNLGK